MNRRGGYLWALFRLSSDGENAGEDANPLRLVAYVRGIVQNLRWRIVEEGSQMTEALLVPPSHIHFPVIMATDADLKVVFNRIALEMDGSETTLPHV